MKDFRGKGDVIRLLLKLLSFIFKCILFPYHKFIYPGSKIVFSFAKNKLFVPANAYKDDFLILINIVGSHGAAVFLIILSVAAAIISRIVGGAIGDILLVFNLILFVFIAVVILVFIICIGKDAGKILGWNMFFAFIWLFSCIMLTDFDIVWTPKEILETFYRFLTAYEFIFFGCFLPVCVVCGVLTSRLMSI